MKGERKLVRTLLGDDPLHKIVKLGTFGVPSIVALISDLTSQTSFFIPALIAGFLAMAAMIYHNIDRARESP